MASKADLLKKNANKTGKGLFAGMTPIKEESNAIFEKKEEPITEANNEKINSVASRTEEIKTTEKLNEKPKEDPTKPQFYNIIYILTKFFKKTTGKKLP